LVSDRTKENAQQRTATMERVPVKSTRLVTLDADSFKHDDVRGALVWLVPTPEMTMADVLALKQRLLDAGAVGVNVRAAPRVKTIAARTQAEPVVPTVRAVVAAMIKEAHCDGFERDELREMVERALCEEGI
jgi:hypothetical protein